MLNRSIHRLMNWLFQRGRGRSITRHVEGGVEDYLFRGDILRIGKRSRKTGKVSDKPGRWPRYFGIVLHKLVAPDPDGVHCHPGDNLSIVLAGGYWEQQADGARKYHGPGSVIFRRAEQFHRLEPGPEGYAWTLFVMGPNRRDWGFLPAANGWRPADFVETDEEPFHKWFGLSYANYLVVPRSVLQAAPVYVQKHLIEGLRLVDKYLGHGWAAPGGYSVRARNEQARFVVDPFAEYRHRHEAVEDLLDPSYPTPLFGEKK